MTFPLLLRLVRILGPGAPAGSSSRLVRRAVVCALAVQLFPPGAGAQEAGRGLGGVDRLVPPALVRVEDVGTLFSPSSAGVLPAPRAPAPGAVRLADAEREFDWLAAGGRLVRWSAAGVPAGPAGGLPGVVETWASVVDGVRVAGASVRRTVRGGGLVDLRGYVLDPRFESTSRSWPSGADPAAAARGLAEALAPGVDVWLEREPSGDPVRLWLPGFDVGDLFPAYVFATSDFRFAAAHAQTGQVLSVEPAVFNGQAPWTAPEFPELWGVDLNLHRAVGSGRGLRGARLLLPLLRTGTEEDPDFRLLDAWDPSTGYQATFDARLVFPRNVPARCHFALRFFLPDRHPAAYRSTLDHVAEAPGGVLGGPDPEDVTVSEAHALMSFVRWYYRDLAGWSGIDGRGGPTPVLVNVAPYGGRLDPSCLFEGAYRSNAFFAYLGGPWGAGGFGFGTWSSTARSTASAVDVVGHEFAHAIAIHGRRNVFGTAFGYTPLRTYFQTENSPGRIQPNGAWVACGEAMPQDMAVRLAEAAGVRVGPYGFSAPEVFPYCVGEYPRRLGFGIIADASEGFPDVAGVGAEFARAQSGSIGPDYIMGEDLDGFGIRDLRLGIGGPTHMADLRRYLVVARHDDDPCRALVSLDVLYTVPYTYSFGLCALSSLGMYGDRPADLTFGGFGSPHGPGVILGHTFYLALEGGRPAGGSAQVVGAGRERLHDLVRAFVEVAAYRPPEAFTMPDLAVAVQANIEERFGAHDPLWTSFIQASQATGLLGF